MIVPIFENERVVAVAGVGNKAESYEFSDARQITLLIDGMWKIIQRQRSEKSLRNRRVWRQWEWAMAAVAHDMKTPLIAIGGFDAWPKGALKATVPSGTSWKSLSGKLNGWKTW